MELKKEFLHDLDLSESLALRVCMCQRRGYGLMSVMSCIWEYRICSECLKSETLRQLMNLAESAGNGCFTIIQAEEK